MLSRRALYQGAARQRCAVQAAQLQRRTTPATTSATARVQTYSTEAVPVIRGNIDPATGRSRRRTTYSSSSSSSSSSKKRNWPRYPKYLKDSPSKTLAIRVKSRYRPLDFATWKLFDAAASSDSMRLPVVALQHMIRADEAVQRTSLSDRLCGEEAQRRRASVLAYKGITKDDLRLWAWILKADTPDERAARFVATPADNKPKPIFLLLQMLQRDNTFMRGTTLAHLNRYIDEHHVQTRKAAAALPFGAVRRTLDAGLNMAPEMFVQTMGLLVHHYLRLWPSALTAVAKLMADYMMTIPAMAKRGHDSREEQEPGEASAAKRDRKVYADMCYVFNAGLGLFRQKAPVEPVANMRYNWRAQRVLLAASTNTSAEGMTRPLLISRNGFRSIRQVLLALGKSPAERRVSMRMARTWPPYRRDWDGLDEQRQPKDDFSRSVQAGVMMHEAGYGDREHERALSVLGGVVPGETPTVQTRSLGPRIWPGRHANLNVYSEWAARVRATRDVNEAWREFSRPGLGSASSSSPSPSTPSAQVYAEMFTKLHAAPVERHHPVESASSTATWPHGKELLPGDAREVYPVHDAALTPFERARISPPTVDQLYNRMLGEGTRPAGECLVVLLKNAATLEEAMRYLHDAALDEEAVAALRVPDTFTASPLSRPSPVLPVRSETRSRSRSRMSAAATTTPTELDNNSISSAVRQIPLRVFNAFIGVLCRLQPVATYTPAGPRKQLRTQLVHHAVRLTMARLPPTSTSGRTFMAPWHMILRRLSYPKVLVGPEHTTDALLHNQEALALALEVSAYLQRTGSGVDDFIFRSIVRAALVYNNNLGAGSDNDGDGELMARAHATIVDMFSGILSDGPGPGSNDDNHPATRHNVKAFTLDLYLKFLAFRRDAQHMAEALAWVVRVYDDAVLLEDAKDVDDAQHSALQRALILYRVVAEASTDARDAAAMAELARQFAALRQKRGATWQWPTADDADAFVQWRRGDVHNRDFWRRIRAVEGEGEMIP